MIWNDTPLSINTPQYTSEQNKQAMRSKELSVPLFLRDNIVLRCRIGVGN